MPDTVSLDAELQPSPRNIIDLGESVTLSFLPQNVPSLLTFALYGGWTTPRHD
ncbi:MAG: hypothetical protein GXP17_09770 [Gammaproteobacteria bacterium]|nr:hypothetical protein [Gammaproteobacteria bacterium]